MKNLIILFIIMTASLFSQGWNNVIETSIPVDDLVSLDLSSNKDGIHVLVNNYYSDGQIHGIRIYTLKYHLLNSSGSLLRSFTLETFQFSGTDPGNPIQFASIDGTNDRIYVIYKLDNQIKTKKSTNAGQSWTNIDPINIGSNTCNNVDITFGKDDNALHVVWATQDNGNDYETYYRRLPSTDQWDAQKTVTDYSNEVGGFPTVSKSSNRVHVSYNTGQSSDPETNFGNPKSRDKYVSTWQTPQLILSETCFRERIHAGNSKLFDFYYQLGDYYSADLYVKERSFGSTSWSSPVLINEYAAVAEIVSVTNTFDGKTHIVYEITGAVAYRNYNGTSWSSEVEIGDEWISPKISSVSNDLFVAWGGFSSFNNYIYYRQYDASPLTPVNFAGVVYNNHPKISWSANAEPDLSYYEIWRQFVVDPKNPGSWVLLTTTTQTNFVDNDIFIGNGSMGDVIYKIRAKDVNNHLSNYTNQISFDFQGLQKQGIESPDRIKDFSLSQNYPNPFNPTTKITYTLSEDAKVNIKIYDMLGTEVAELVNETKPTGYYETTFDASNLSSGVYIYRITALSGDRILFSQSKQMILIK